MLNVVVNEYYSTRNFVAGNVAFAKGPKVTRLNNFELQETANRSWFKDQTVNIRSTAKVDNVNLLDHLFIQVGMNIKLMKDSSNA